jgi:hydroxyacyl-ACP dehydratase HTD2-like protein with hotdog domain
VGLFFSPVTTRGDVERFNYRNLNDMKAKEDLQVKISNRFAALGT